MCALLCSLYMCIVNIHIASKLVSFICLLKQTQMTAIFIKMTATLKVSMFVQCSLNCLCCPMGTKNSYGQDFCDLKAYIQNCPLVYIDSWCIVIWKHVLHQLGLFCTLNILNTLHVLYLDFSQNCACIVYWLCYCMYTSVNVSSIEDIHVQELFIAVVNILSWCTVMPSYFNF